MFPRTRLRISHRSLQDDRCAFDGAEYIEFRFKILRLLSEIFLQFF